MDDKKKDKLVWWVLITVIIGTFLGALDQTVVNLALPDIIDEFDLTVSSSGWIATAYILANAVFVPVWGKLGDTIGRKKVYIFGFIIFIIGSVLSGFAWSLESMILFRIIQAIGSSADYPTAMAIIASTFKEGRARARALGIWSSAFAAATVLGPLIGGPIIDHIGWRFVFFINLPIGILGILMAIRFVTESTSEKKTKNFDWWGAITLGIALASLILVLEKGYGWGWASINSLLCYTSIITFIHIFIKIEKNVSDPIVDLGFFKIPTFVNVISNNFIVFMGMMGSVFLIPIFTQTFLGYSATEAGFLFMPMAICMVISAALGGNLTGKVKSKYVIYISTTIAALGLSLFAFLDPKSGALGVVIPLCIMALGMGLGMAQRTNLITSVVKSSAMGAASSVLSLARSISGAFGIAIFSTLLNNRIEHNILQINNFSQFLGATSKELQTFIALIGIKAQINAYHFVFITSSVIVALGAFTILTLKVKNEKNVGEKEIYQVSNI